MSESFYIYETKYKKHWYEMLQRPPGPGCQPSGILETDHEKGRHGIVAYDRELTDGELKEYTMRKWEGLE